jgi:acetyl esterase/lipase
VIGNIDTHDVLCRQLCDASGCAVFSVDYRLAPEHPFPAAYDDALHAFHWVVDNATSLHIDPTRVAVGGDSAGGNLAAAVCLGSRDSAQPPAFQLLIYPATIMYPDTPSYHANGQGYLLTAAAMDWFMDHYLPNAADRHDWRASPLKAPSHANLPPALVLTAGFDPLRDEGLMYADAMGAAGHLHEGQPVLAMSFYPKEGMPLWDKYSTHAIAHTLDVYSRFSFPYPYPVAISVNGPVGGGMEYPMICFNRPRPEPDGTYAARTKYGLIGVVIHEVGHNYFPMIVNSDERQWTWMDEGLNSFLQLLAHEEWEKNWPQRRDAREITAYMRRPDRVAIMANSESIRDLGNNSYAQPTVALNILRDVVMGRELFDHAFKTYAQRWMFKRPTPADFFRTIEDASGIDLDWFWRGWFYSTDHVDLAIDQVRWLRLDTQDPAVEKAQNVAERQARPITTTRERNARLPKRIDRFPELKDFYDDYDEATVLPSERSKFQNLLKDLATAQVDPALLTTARNFYLIDFSNVGGIVMPLPLRLEFSDGSIEELHLGAELWRHNTEKCSKLIMTTKELKSVTLDPRDEMADVEIENNFWPRRLVKTKFQLFKEETEKNPLRELRPPAKE